MMTLSFGLEVSRMSLRDFSGSSATVIPALASIGMVSSKMRPFESARVRISDMALLFHALRVLSDPRSLLSYWKA